jgi:hypothetical protein
LPEAEALARLARRYLAAFGPAAAQDLAAWSGLPLAQARVAWRSIERELVPVQAAGQPAWMPAEDLQARLAWLEEYDPERPTTRLLPRFDTSLLGYSDRNLVIDPQHARRIHPGGGILHAALSVDGCILGTWRSRRRKDWLEISIEPFDPLPEVLSPGLQAEIEDIGRFSGMKSRGVNWISN